MIQQQREEYALNLLLEEFKIPLETGVFDFQFRFEGFIYDGPIFVRTRKKYYEHAIKSPIGNRIYWISTLEKGMYRLYKPTSNCNTFFCLNENSSEIEIPDYKMTEFKSAFVNSLQYQAVACLILYCFKTCSIKGIKGELFSELFKNFYNEQGDITMNINWFKDNSENSNPNIFNVNLF